MITRPTVLILGAGASKPYGFPSGPELVQKIVVRLQGQFFKDFGFSESKTEEFRNAMEALERTQLNVLGEANEQLELLARWIDSHPDVWLGEAIITSDLLGKLRELHVGPDRDFPFKGAGALGTWLGRHTDLIQAQLQIRVEKDFIGHVRGWSFTKTRCEDVKAANHQENKGKYDVHTFTPSSAETAGENFTLKEELLVDAD